MRVSHHKKIAQYIQPDLLDLCVTSSPEPLEAFTEKSSSSTNVDHHRMMTGFVQEVASQLDPRDFVFRGGVVLTDLCVNAVSETSFSIRFHMQIDRLRCLYCFHRPASRYGSEFLCEDCAWIKYADLMQEASFSA